MPECAELLARTCESSGPLPERDVIQIGLQRGVAGTCGNIEARSDRETNGDAAHARRAVEETARAPSSLVSS